MIDKNKMEKAAREAADLYEQDFRIMYYNKDTEVDGQHQFCQKIGPKIFKDGAKWSIAEFFKNLFHPAEDIPEENRPILVVYKHGGYGIERWEAYNFSGQANSWTFDITQWLYIDDLFPKKKDNQ